MISLAGGAVRRAAPAAALFNRRRVEREDKERIMFERILVATDGSELAERGVDAGIELAKKTKGELFFVTVTSLMPSYGMSVGAEWAASPGTLEDYRHEMESGAKTILAGARPRRKKPR